MATKKELEGEIAKLKELLKNYNEQALAYEKSVDERLGQIRELLNKRRWMPTNPDETILPLGWHEWVISTNQILEELVGLLGQNLEKPGSKKGENK